MYSGNSSGQKEDSFFIENVRVREQFVYRGVIWWRRGRTFVELVPALETPWYLWRMS